MSRVIRVKYEGGVLKPLEEPLRFSEGEELIVEVKERVGRGGIERFFGVVKTKTKKWETLIGEEEYYEHVSERGGVP